MDEELNKLKWFLEGPFFTMVPPPSPHESGQEFGEYLNENNLTVISLDVVSNLRKQLNAKEKEWEEEREEMMEELKKSQLKKDLFMANQTKLVECIRKIAELTEFNETFGSKDSNFVLVGESDLDRFYDHVKSSFKKVSPNSHPSSESTTSTSAGEDKEKPTKKRVRVMDSSGEEYGESQDNNESPRQVTFKVINRTTDHVLPPLSPQPCSSSSLLSESDTKWRCNWCMGRFDTAKEYVKHRKIVHPVLAESRDHDESNPRYLTREPSLLYRRYIHTSNHIRRKVKSYVKTNDKTISDDDDDNNGIEEDTEIEDEANRLERPRNCSVCGDPFQDMILLKNHLETKHEGKG